MIEKLDLQKRNSFGLLDWRKHNSEPSGAELIENKINEIICYINQNNHEYASIEEVVKARENHTENKNE